MTGRRAPLLLAVVAAFAPGLSGPPPAAAQGVPLPTATIAILRDGPAVRFAGFADLVRQETMTLLGSDFDARIPDSLVVEADGTIPGVRAALDRLLRNPDVDVIVAIGAIGSQLAATRGALPRPVVASFVVDAQLQGAPETDGTSGVRNLVYLSQPEPLNLQTFREIAEVKHLAILFDASLAAAIPDMGEAARRRSEDLGIEATIVTVGDSAGAALARLSSGGFDGVLVLPLPRMTESEFRRLAAGLVDLRLPSFSWLGEPEVRDGILAGRHSDGFQRQLARLAGLQVQRILLGDPAADLSVSYVPQDRLSINMATARAIGVYPPWSLLTEATLVDEEEKAPVRHLTLPSTIQEALTANPDLLAAERRVAAGAQDVKVAGSALLPQVGIEAKGTFVDEYRAERSLGILPERALWGSATLSQVLYDDATWARKSIESSFQKSRVQDFASLRLDVALAAAVAYLNVLDRKTAERIRREDLALSRANLELAQVRRRTGAASAGEVYRWETEVAISRQLAVSALAATKMAEMDLNRILNRPLEETFTTAEQDLDDPRLALGDQRLMRYMDNPWSFRVFRDFLAREALEDSPELRSLDARTAAHQRELARTNRAFFLPSFGLEAGLFSRLAEGGAGSTTDSIPGLPADGFSDSGSGDLRWNISLVGRYPVFTGTRRLAEKSRAVESLAALDEERQGLTEQVEQRLRTAAVRMGASRANVDLSRAAAAAARRNLDLVTESYSRGLATVLDLLDAQHTSVRADLDASSVYYTYLIDVVTTLRAIGTFEFIRSETDREAFFRRLDEFVEREGNQ